MKAEREDLFKAVENTKGKSQEIQERLNGLTAAKEQLHHTMDQVCFYELNKEIKTYKC